MTKINEAIRRYRDEVRRTKQTAPYKGVFARSRRELVAICLTSLAGIAAVVIPVSVYQYSVAMQAAVPAAVVAVTGGIWFAWIVWGRDAFPLKSSTVGACSPKGTTEPGAIHSGPTAYW